MSNKVSDNTTRDASIAFLVIAKLESKAAVSRKFNISPRTVGRVVDRFRAENPAGTIPVDPIAPVTIEGATQKKPLIVQIPLDETFEETGQAVTKRKVGMVKGEKLQLVQASSRQTHTTANVEPVEPVEPEVAKVYSAVVMPHTINIWFGDELVSYTRETTNPKRFEDIVEMLVTYKMSQGAIAEAFKMLSPRLQIMACDIEGVEVCIKSSSVSYFGRKITGLLAARIIDAASRGDRTIFDRLTNFTAKLYKNPSNRAIDQLYDFIEATDIEIADNGNVVCYKRVRENFFDIYSNTIDYSVGNVVRMDRNAVVEDPRVTCAAGLHVCSISYLSHYSSSRNDAILQCEVSPEHFVAIPEDYYRKDANSEFFLAKARVCEIISMGVLDKSALGLN